MTTQPMRIDGDAPIQPLTDAEWGELAEILADERWPETTLDLEGLDGVIAAGACGPRQLLPMQVLPLIFGRIDMPEFENAERFSRFLELASRRWNEYAHALDMDPDKMGVDDLIEPFCYEGDSEQLALANAWKAPKKVTEETFRPGDWMGREWASGFVSVVHQYPDAWWEITAMDEGLSQLFSPFLMLELGFNPDQPKAPFTPDEWLTVACVHLYHFANMYRTLATGEFERSPVVRDAPKVGRNDACPCGSGLKFKKCCGGADKVTH